MRFRCGVCKVVLDSVRDMTRHASTAHTDEEIRAAIKAAEEEDEESHG